MQGNLSFFQCAGVAGNECPRVPVGVLARDENSHLQRFICGIFNPLSLFEAPGMMMQEEIGFIAVVYANLPCIHKVEGALWQRRSEI
ncbi:MAG: hypothetical protein MUC66_02365 [Methanolinea sp.]|nr:hypothetical protein [Methanolinea sp.]